MSPFGRKTTRTGEPAAQPSPEVGLGSSARLGVGFTEGGHLIASSHGTFGYAWPSELGWIAVLADSARLYGLTFGDPSLRAARERAVASGQAVEAWSPIERAPSWLRDFHDRLDEYGMGRPVSLDVPLNLDGLGRFHRRVIQCCRRIPFGSVVTYGQLARAAGSPRAARSVGTAMSGNRFPLVVPCHRVVSSQGLGGYSAPDGLHAKRRLLKLEGAWPPEPDAHSPSHTALLENASP